MFSQTFQKLVVGSGGLNSIPLSACGEGIGEGLADAATSAPNPLSASREGGSKRRTTRKVVMILAVIVGIPILASGQSHKYPDTIRGYKVERTVVEIKKSDNKTRGGNGNGERTNDEADVDQLITFGQSSIARVTPLGITIEVPVVVAPVKQSGKIDFLTFEDMEVNGHSVQIDEYKHSFSLPNKNPLTLPDPLRIYIYLPGAILAALGDWTDAKPTWPITGRVYVFGKFKKKILGISTSFKRVVPVELNLTMRNPLKAK